MYLCYTRKYFIVVKVFLPLIGPGEQSAGEHGHMLCLRACGMQHACLGAARPAKALSRS